MGRGDRVIRWHKVEWRKVQWVKLPERQELFECAEYAPEELNEPQFHIDRLEVPVEGLKERMERLERLDNGDG